MEKKIQAALISVFYKEGLEPIVKKLHQLGVTIYSTGGTQQFIEQIGITVIPVDSITGYPAILGGRVKTLHPSVFGGILGRRSNAADISEMKQFNIPAIDLVIVDLYPFQETVAAAANEQQIIDKIDIGGPSMIRAAAKNHSDVAVIASKSNYVKLIELLEEQGGVLTLEQRREFAADAFRVVTDYDIAISNYFHPGDPIVVANSGAPVHLRYGENPHQQAVFYGNPAAFFEQLHGKEISYNNLVDIDAAIQLAHEFQDNVFAIIKHTNVCGIASRKTVTESWKAALAGDPESAFGGVLITNGEVNDSTASAISEIFFEVLLAPSFTPAALKILQAKKNRILLQLQPDLKMEKRVYKSALNGMLMQDVDEGNFLQWDETGARESTPQERVDLLFANIICKHLKSNAIALVKKSQLVGKGCGQTSRIDALRQAIEKAGRFQFNLKGAVMASDAFFPFDDCVKLGHQAGITAFIQPGGSVRDKDSIDYCRQNNLAMVITGMRHFRH